MKSGEKYPPHKNGKKKYLFIEWEGEPEEIFLAHGYDVKI